METDVNELLDILFDMIDEAKNIPFAGDKCMLERDKALDLIEEIRSNFPMELSEAKKLISTKNDYLASAKREAERIVQQAQEKAKQLTAEDKILSQVKQKSAEIIRKAEERSKELRQAANVYCEDILRRTEEAVAEAYDEIKKSRNKFHTAAAGFAEQNLQGQSGQVFDAEAEH